VALALRKVAPQDFTQHTIVGLPEIGILTPWDPEHLGSRNPRLHRSPTSRFKIRLANTEGRRSSASYLIHKMYSWRGYATSPLPMTEPSRITLIASDQDDIVGTISVGFDSEAGLLVDGLYLEEVDGLRALGRRVCEFTKLAVERTIQSRELLAMLFQIAYLFAYRIHGFTDLVIEVNPRHVKFYQSMLGFKELGPERMNQRVHAPAVLMHLDLGWCSEQIGKYAGLREEARQGRSLYPYGFTRAEEEGILERLRCLA
jgi:hypothetical protein